MKKRIFFHTHFLNDASRIPAHNHPWTKQTEKHKLTPPTNLGTGMRAPKQVDLRLQQ
jgi:hypothetical protein